MSRHSRPLHLLPFLVLAGCVALGPDPAATPDAGLAARFAAGGAAPAGEVAGRAFWTDYRDQMLTGFIQRGLSANLTVRAAEERIRAAEADLRAAGVLGSQAGGSATLQREATGIDDSAASYVTTGTLGASFVFDLFGKARRGREAAAAGLRSAEAGVETARLGWLAETIAAYSDARYFQQALALTRETIRVRERTVEITRNKMDVGTGTQFDLAQAEAQLATARADLPAFDAQFNAQVFRLARLMDVPAGPLLAQMQRGAAPLRTPAGPSGGVPADLLRNRPDIRAAEQALVAAVARVGVAEADLLPSLSLTGRVTDLSGRSSWGFGPQLSLPIFNQAALQSARDRRSSEARQAELAWRSQIAIAVEDVERGLSNLRRYRQRVATLAAAVRAQDEAYRLAETNFEAGSLSLLNLLEVDRARAAARMSLASAQNDAAKQWAALEIATGAGAGLR